MLHTDVVLQERVGGWIRLQRQHPLVRVREVDREPSEVRAEVERPALGGFIEDGADMVVPPGACDQVTCNGAFVIDQEPPERRVDVLRHPYPFSLASKACSIASFRWRASNVGFPSSPFTTVTCGPSIRSTRSTGIPRPTPRTCSAEQSVRRSFARLMIFAASSQEVGP